MKISLINYTENAKELLIFSKNTRLNMSSSGFDEILNKTEEEKNKELEYVFGTIRSSLEFVDYVFMIEGVTRAFTHQLVRHRVGVSFAQQSMRTVDMGEFDYLASGGTINNKIYSDAMDGIKENYKKLIESGVKPEDARGLLPTNILTNILMKINLRALSDLMNVRLCLRVQEEFRNVMEEVKKETAKVHPWAEELLQLCCKKKDGYCMFKRYPCKYKEENLNA